MIHNVLNKVKKTVKYWWISLLIGILGIFLGIWCLATPASSLAAITSVFIIVFILGGILEIIFAVSNRKVSDGWGWSLAGGILELMLGILLLALPFELVTGILIYLVGFWMLFRSVMSIVESCQLQMMHVKGWGWLLALGILCLVFSFLYLMSPVFGGIFIVIFVGISLLSYGIFRIVLAFKLKSVYKDIREIME